jgi:hypothetical protein
MAIISIGSEHCIRQERRIIEMLMLSRALSFRFGRFVFKKMAFNFVKRKSIFADVMPIMFNSLRNDTASLHIKPHVCFFSFNKNHPLRPKCPTLAVNSYFLI